MNSASRKPKPIAGQAATSEAGPSKAANATLSSRERGRQYRARLKIYQKRLHQDVSDLRKHVRDLQMLSKLQNQLVHCSKHAATAVVERVYEELDQRRCDKINTVDECAVRHQLRSHVESFKVVCSSDTPVIALHGMLRGKLRLDVIHRLYFCVPGNSALLDAFIDRDVRFPTTRTLFLGVDGAVVRQVDDTDYASVLGAFAHNALELSEMLREIEATTTTCDCLKRELEDRSETTARVASRVA